MVIFLSIFRAGPEYGLQGIPKSMGLRNDKLGHPESFGLFPPVWAFKRWKFVELGRLNKSYPGCLRFSVGRWNHFFSARRRFFSKS